MADVVNGVATATGLSRQISPLVSYAVHGLGRCWMPAREMYSYRFCFDVPEPNESVPESDAFYTLNVLLGFSRAGMPEGWTVARVRRVFEACCAALRSPRARNYMLGMALWSGAAFGIEPPGFVIDRIRSTLADHGGRLRLTAQDIGMLTSGAIAMAGHDDRRWRHMAEGLAADLRQHYFHPSSHVFRNQRAGYRRNFSSFASQVYSILALYQFGEAFAQDWAIDVANRAAARIISLQGPRGEWGWFYYVPRGAVVDFYEIYSVHQHGMAPAFLHHAVAHGVAGAREALVKGFLWLFGNNEMGVSMLRPAESMFYRSQLRVGELASTRRRLRRSIVNAVLGRSDSAANCHGPALRRECRSYELGWLLWSFGGRSDYPELTQHTQLRQ